MSDDRDAAPSLLGKRKRSDVMIKQEECDTDNDNNNKPSPIKSSVYDQDTDDEEAASYKLKQSALATARPSPVASSSIVKVKHEENAYDQDTDDEEGHDITSKPKPDCVTEGLRRSRCLRNLIPLLEELEIKRGSTDVIYVSVRLLNREYDILDHLSYFGAQHLYVKLKPGDGSSAHQSRRKKMTTALNKYQCFHGMIQTNIMDSDINKDIKSGKLIIYEDSPYTDEANGIIASAEVNPHDVINLLARSNILLTYNKRSVLPPKVCQTITRFKRKSTNKINTYLSSGCIDRYHPDNSANTIINVTLSFPIIGRSNNRFDPNKRSHGKLHKNYKVTFSIDLNNINTDQLIPINIMNVKAQPAGREKTFRLFGREFDNTKKYTDATMEERKKFNAIDLEDFYFCMMVDSTGSGLRLPVYINMKTYIVWALVRDYLNKEITDKAIRHANSITDNGNISGFFGNLISILVKYIITLKITEWKATNEDITEMNYFNNIDNKTHKGIQSFLDCVVRTSSEFMIRLMKHSLHNFRKYLPRNDLTRIGWVLWGQDNAQWYGNQKMHKYLENNPLGRNYFLFISLLQSYDTKEKDTEMIALILSCMAKNSHAFDKIYAGANFDDVMNEYARLLEPYSASNERAFLHMSAMFVLSVLYDGEIPMDPIKLRAFHPGTNNNNNEWNAITSQQQQQPSFEKMEVEVFEQQPSSETMMEHFQANTTDSDTAAAADTRTRGVHFKKTPIILDASPDGRNMKIRVDKDRHVADLIRSIIQSLKDDEIGDLTPTQLEKCIEYVCRRIPENPAAYFNEFAGEFGQIFHHGKGKQLDFVRQVEKMMILDDNNNIGLNYIGVEAIFHDWKLYSKKKDF